MIKLFANGSYWIHNQVLVEDASTAKIDDINLELNAAGLPQISASTLDRPVASTNTMSYGILKAHNTSGNMQSLAIKFDAMASHDITYVGIVQTARASGLEKFPIPYVLTNCHNSLCAVGGTINEDDHVFGRSAAQKYGGIYVPAHQAVIHSYMREMMSGGGKMILGSDSHTRYGAYGTMAIGEGGPELVKQLLEKTYDVKYPGVVAVYLEGAPKIGVGPQDVALAIIGQVFKNGFVKNKVMEFIGPGIANLSVDYRSGIDVMTTETTCLSSVWATDDLVKENLMIHGRPHDYKEMKPEGVIYYDGLIIVNLSEIVPMIALPFHPSNVYAVEELVANPVEILKSVEAEARQIFGKAADNFNLTHKITSKGIQVDQGIVAGCAGGTFENIYLMGEALENANTGADDFTLNVYPGSQPIFFELNRIGTINKLMQAGAGIKTAFCGPCFGAGDVPSNSALSIRHTTRNFPNREGSKPGDGQIASVALMDARSITATALNKGILTPATAVNMPSQVVPYTYNPRIYEHRVYQGFNAPDAGHELKFGPNIKDWPKMSTLTDHLLLKVASVIRDAVTTTDELIPSGETSSYRSNPLRLAEFTLSRKDPNYVPMAKSVQLAETNRLEVLASGAEISGTLANVYNLLDDASDLNTLVATTGVGSIIYANKPGDGSAREQAASCQKVLGTWANLAQEYATKRYRSNLINWGMLPLITKEADIDLQPEDFIFIPNIKTAIENNQTEMVAFILRNGKKRELTLYLPDLAPDDREILLSGCLMNFYNKDLKK